MRTFLRQNVFLLRRAGERWKRSNAQRQTCQTKLTSVQDDHLLETGRKMVGVYGHRSPRGVVDLIAATTGYAGNAPKVNREPTADRTIRPGISTRAMS